MGDPAQFEAAYQRFIAELDSGKLFEYARNSHAGRQLFSRGRGRFKQVDSQTGKLISTLGRLAEVRRELLPVALEIIRAVNPHSSVAEWSAKLFEVAKQALEVEYDDVEKRSGPEPFRPSQCHRPYTREERLIVLEVLRSRCDDYTGLGWAAERLARELGCLGFIQSLTERF